MADSSFLVIGSPVFVPMLGGFPPADAGRPRASGWPPEAAQKPFSSAWFPRVFSRRPAGNIAPMPLGRKPTLPARERSPPLWQNSDNSLTAYW